MSVVIDDDPIGHALEDVEMMLEQADGLLGSISHSIVKITDELRKQGDRAEAGRRLQRIRDAVECYSCRCEVVVPGYGLDEPVDVQCLACAILEILDADEGEAR